MVCLIICLSQLFFLVFLLHSQPTSSSSFSSSSTLSCSQEQSSALLKFKRLHSYPTSSSSKYSDDCDQKKESWKEGRDCCSWDGVTCDTMGRDVIGLDLSCSELQGTIHSNSSLFLLPNLQQLNLAFNCFNSPISSGFGQFAKLEKLDLSSSQFSGQVPHELSKLSKLSSLDLSGNKEVSLNTSVMRRLVQNLTKLRELRLDGVQMSLVSLDSLMNLSSSLTVLSLNGCGLHGNLPYNIFHLPNLRELSLICNPELRGAFPTTNWSNPLMFLDVSTTGFSGPLPNSIDNLKFLKHLGLSQCNFNGLLPASFGNLTQITVLDLSGNNFVGELPSSLSNLKNLSFLNLRCNKLSGSIPESFGNLTKVTYCYLSSNNFIGHIPSSLSNLKDLTFLDLGGNKFEGTLPDFLTKLTKLTNLDLNSNHLIGPIGEFQHAKSLKNILLYNNRLNGSFPKSISNLVKLQKLDISSNNLSGTIEFDMFSKLNEINFLDLSYNSLSLSINNNLKYTFPNLTYLKLASCNITKFPYFLRTLESLDTLDLSNNRIKGQVPKWMFKVLGNLKSLNLSHNSLTSIEQILGENLENLDLHANFLQGTFLVLPSSVVFFSISNNNLTGEIPSSICNLTLQILDISFNNLTGTIPRCLGYLSDFLSVMDLRTNRFHGTIPEMFAKCKSLRTLVFNHNQLGGSLPQSLVNCRKLEVLDFGNNKINDSFPYWLEALPKLQVLVLRCNRFYGQIEDFKANSSFAMLRIIDISQNNFMGHLTSNFFEGLKAIKTVNENEVSLKYIGEDYYQDSVMVVWKGHERKLERILTIFTTIDLSCNKFHGQIPKVLGKLQFLRELNLSHNSLTGYIPSSLGNLLVLESLDLSSNMLNGSIPVQLTSLTFLAVLNLSQNKLTGPIPQGPQFNTFQNDSYIGNKGLCGFPLSKKCRIVEPPQSEEDNDLKFTSGFGWKAVMMGYGCGFVYGIAMGYLVSKSRKPQWLVSLVGISCFQVQKTSIWLVSLVKGE